MATPRSEELRALAGRVAAALPETATDVVLTGSTSRGVADELSDVELLVVSDEPPGDLPLEDVERLSPPASGATWVGGAVEGEPVELVWWTAAHAEERVRAIAAGETADWQRPKSAEAIVNGVSLRGERHGRWAGPLARYPEGLTQRIVDDASDWVDPTRAYRSILRPGCAVSLAFRVAEAAENILRIVFALNAEWSPGWKRFPERVGPLALKPDRLAERLELSVRSLDVASLRALAAETLALAPQTPRTRKAQSLLREPL